MHGGNPKLPESFSNRGMERWDRRIAHPTHLSSPLNHNGYFWPVRVLSVYKKFP